MAALARFHTQVAITRLRRKCNTGASGSHSTHVAFVFMNNKYLQIGRGAGYVVGAILDAGFPVVFYDTRLKSIDSISMEIARHDFNVLMVSTMSQFFPEVLDLVARVKKHKAIPVLVGGIHPTSVGESILERHPEIDFLCIGDGESMVEDFLITLGRFRIRCPEPCLSS